MSMLGNIRKNLNRDVKEVFELDEETRLASKREEWLKELAQITTDTGVPYEALHLAAVTMLAGEPRSNAAQVVADLIPGGSIANSSNFGISEILETVERMVTKDGDIWKDYGQLPYQPPADYKSAISQNGPEDFPVWQG